MSARSSLLQITASPDHKIAALFIQSCPRDLYVERMHSKLRIFIIIYPLCRIVDFPWRRHQMEGSNSLNSLFLNTGTLYAYSQHVRGLDTPSVKSHPCSVIYNQKNKKGTRSICDNTTDRSNLIKILRQERKQKHMCNEMNEVEIWSYRSPTGALNGDPQRP